MAKKKTWEDFEKDAKQYLEIEAWKELRASRITVSLLLQHVKQEVLEEMFAELFDLRYEVSMLKQRKKKKET